MSRAMLARKAEPETAARAHVAAGGLKISQPGDALEREADRVADAVTSGGRLPSWSLSSVAVLHVQRQGAPDAAQPASTSAPQPNDYKEAAQKAGDAFLQTDVGKKLKTAAAQDPLAKGAQDFLSSLPGKIIAGTAAAAAVAAMAATHTPLPAQLPEIPLDQIRPGLKVKITWEGPVDHPTKAMIAFSYSPGEAAKKKKGGATESERYRAETARMAADMDKFRAGMTYAPGSPQDLQQKGDEHAIQSWMAKRLGALPGTPGGAPLVPGGAAGSQQSAGTELRLPSYQSPLAARTPHLLDQQLQLKPMSEAPASEDTKREEQPVQRMAMSDVEVSAPSGMVDEFLHSSSGRPLDRDTRGSMESRFGVDFSHVRVHTDAGAAASARSVNASAYTVGSDVVFASGHYAPHTDQGQHLLAHELAHVVQQGGTAMSVPRDRTSGRLRSTAATARAHPTLHLPQKKASSFHISEPDDPLEREAESFAAAVSSGMETPRLSHTPLGGSLVQRQWSDAPRGPRGGARSGTVTAPSSGWNRDEVAVGSIRRIPIEGLKSGNQAKDRDTAAAETAEGRAIVLIPGGLDATKPVEVLLHLHGHNVGYRQRRTQALDPLSTPGTVRDVEMDRIEQQIQASRRPMIAVLPQGTAMSNFGAFDSDAYIREVFRVLSNRHVFGNHPAPRIERVVLSGHSGAGKPLTAMMAEPGQPRMPSSLGEVALFDSINSDAQLGIVKTWVQEQLNHDLSQLTVAGITPAQQQAYLSNSLRFRAYYTNSSYAAVHESLSRFIGAWFTRHAAALGGRRSAVFADLRSHYQVLPVRHGLHDRILGRNDKLLDALNALPSASAGGSAATVPAQRPLHPRRKDSGKPGHNTGKLVDDALRSPGRPLDAQTQIFLSVKFQHDFRNVRIHDDGCASASARAIHADAYTVGQHIVFGAGNYQPSSPQGRRLLAHEITHVLQQRGRSSGAADSIQRQATVENLQPIRSDESGKTLVSFAFGSFSIFVPKKVIFGARKDIQNPKVHVFFSAAGVQGNLGNDILTHGLRGASDQSDWILIGVPSPVDRAGVPHPLTITDRQIVDCLASLGIHSPVASLRLSGHSRGAFGLMNSIVQRKITTLSLIDRVTLLDADDNPDPRDPQGVTTTPKVEVLKRAGIDASKITAYEVNVRKRHISGATYISLDSSAMAAIGYVRLIRDAMVTQPGIAAMVAGNQAIKSQLDSLPLPPRGSFTTSAPKPNQTSLQKFATDHRSQISAIIAKDSRSDGLLTFINANRLPRFGPFQFSRGIAAHHFFTAEVAHELTE